MPQINIEHSANLAVEGLRELAADLHRVLPAIIDSAQDSFKTRLTRIDDFVIGDGADAHGMLHLDVRILTGRSEAVKTQAGQAALDAAVRRLGAVAPGMDVQVTVEIGELDRANYHKTVVTG
jgi:5-carboxymethyl-2-hydroxymuconate isomerase